MACSRAGQAPSGLKVFRVKRKRTDEPSPGTFKRCKLLGTLESPEEGHLDCLLSYHSLNTRNFQLIEVGQDGITSPQDKDVITCNDVPLTSADGTIDYIYDVYIEDFDEYLDNKETMEEVDEEIDSNDENYDGNDYPDDRYDDESSRSSDDSDKSSSALSDYGQDDYLGF